MDSASVTTAAIITFSEALEDQTTVFYEGLAERWADHADMFSALARDGKKNKTHIVRTYQETISDALEASYCFEGLNLDDYALETALDEGTSLADAATLALNLEEKACAFYLDVAARSESLLGTIPRAFKRVAKRRAKRKPKLEALGK
jgi:rubrerythrin